MTTLRNGIKRRISDIIERSEIYHIDPPVYQDLYDKAERVFLNGSTCCYCREQIKLSDSPPYLHVFSIDHDIPLALGGNNYIDNLVICCHKCNIIKGTMTGKTFKKFLSYVPLDLQKIMFNEMWKGRLASKLTANDFEKKESKYDYPYKDPRAY